MAKLRPFYDDVQTHYDLSDEFFALFLDPSMTYSCAYFERDDMTLAEAQAAKIDLALGKCGLNPGDRLLDIGCGWGSCVRRAAERYRADVAGLTLSKNQYEHAAAALADLPPGAGRAEVRLQGWEEFDQPVDAIVSIGAFEHFRIERYRAFFDRCRALLRPGRRMLLHTILFPDAKALREAGVELTHQDVLFGKFIRKHIFPGGQLCAGHVVVTSAEAGGFEVTRVQSLQPHYARTLDQWAEALASRRDRAVELTSEETYRTYTKYLTGCADLFRQGKLDVAQFSLLAR